MTRRKNSNRKNLITKEIFEMNQPMLRDIFNRIKLARGRQLKAPELTWLSDKVEAAFVKHSKLLFPAEPVPFWKPPKLKLKK